MLSLIAYSERTFFDTNDSEIKNHDETCTHLQIIITTIPGYYNQNHDMILLFKCSLSKMNLPVIFYEEFICVEYEK